MEKRKNLLIQDKSTLQHRVIKKLREAIIIGTFEPGERLVQDVLAKELGVSRMPIREALRQLESEGLVEFETHKGALVKKLTIEEVDETYSLRATLEAMALEKSVPNLTDEDIEELEQLLISMEEEVEAPDDFIETNMAFHKLLMKGVEWKKLHSFIEQLSHGISNITPFLIEEQMRNSKKEHRLIFEAVKDKDSELAAEYLKQHIKRTGDSLKKYMQKQ